MVDSALPQYTYVCIYSIYIDIYLLYVASFCLSWVIFSSLQAWVGWRLQVFFSHERRTRVEADEDKKEHASWLAWNSVYQYVIKSSRSRENELNWAVLGWALAAGGRIKEGRTGLVCEPWRRWGGSLVWLLPGGCGRVLLSVSTTGSLCAKRGDTSAFCSHNLSGFAPTLRCWKD